jgi:hypothetical protein
LLYHYCFAGDLNFLYYLFLDYDSFTGYLDLLNYLYLYDFLHFPDDWRRCGCGRGLGRSHGLSRL